MVLKQGFKGGRGSPHWVLASLAAASEAFDNRDMRHRQYPRALPVLLALSALLAGCSNSGVFLSSAPPGARVLVDGTDTGFVTPCALDLEYDHKVDVEFVLPGYETAGRRLVDEGSAYWILWREMRISMNTWRFPLWLSFEDFFVPLKRKKGKSPSRIFVRLRREADR
jgi:hypothetical protein